MQIHYCFNFFLIKSIKHMCENLKFLLVSVMQRATQHCRAPACPRAALCLTLWVELSLPEETVTKLIPNNTVAIHFTQAHPI